jgi:hypothetical protein
MRTHVAEYEGRVQKLDQTADQLKGAVKILQAAHEFITDCPSKLSSGARRVKAIENISALMWRAVSIQSECEEVLSRDGANFLLARVRLLERKLASAEVARGDIETQNIELKKELSSLKGLKLSL